MKTFDHINYFSSKPKEALKAKLRSREINPDNLVKVDDHFYNVTDPTPYIVFTKISYCDCPYGKSGQFCKHQLAIKGKYWDYCEFTHPLLDHTGR